MAQVTMNGVSKRYGDVTALETLDLTVIEGEFLSLLGPSGCGKTTTLRLIAGFIEPSSGRILIGADDVTRVSPQKRQIGMVFQDYALFPHLTVAENVGFGLRERGVPKRKVEERVEELLHLIHLPDLGPRYPTELSGGQCQRVAVARAVAFPPRVLLMDEPLGALDLKMRENMQIELRRLQKELGITTVYVTHDQAEAMTMSDRIAVINGGRLIQLDVPSALYRQPRTRFVADFVGNINLLSCRILGQEKHLLIAQAKGETIHVAKPNDAQGLSNADITLAIRPEHLVLLGDGESMNGMSTLPGRVGEQTYTGNLTRVSVVLSDDTSLMVECRPDDVIPVHGRMVRVGWSTDRAVILDD